MTDSTKSQIKEEVVELGAEEVSEYEKARRNLSKAQGDF